jgi:hypothetical protein
MEMQKTAKERIHHHLKEASPNGVHKARKIFSFKYHKLVLFALFIAAAYYVFTKPQVIDFISGLQKLSYPGIFLSGIFLVFGFTAPFSIGFFLNVEVDSIILAALIGGIGGMFADLFIFKMIRFSFMDELKELEKTKTLQKIEKIVKNNRHIRLKHYLLYLFSGLMIASPLPDEIGVSILAGLTTVKPLKLALISFALHTGVILSLIYFGIKVI